MEMLTQWVTAVKLRNAVNYTDINRTAENLALRLLNTAYDYNLKNLNWDQYNYPAVDLGDQKRGIAFQVTASDDLKKIRDTVEKFYALEGPHKEFPGGLCFFFIKEKTPALSAETKRKLKTKYGFEVDRQILSIKELLMRMEELYTTDRKRFLRVKDLLEEEWGYGTGKINRRKVLEELYRGSKRYLASLRGGGGRFRYLKISNILLAPTRKSQRKEWLDTPVVLDGKADEFPDDERVSSNVLEAIPQLWQEACRHAMLKGEGGMGKTVSFIRLWEQYTAGDEYNPLLPVPVFIPLNEYNETDELERKGFIQRLIRRFYLDEKMQDLDLLNVFREQVKGEKRGMPSVILLLDGLNEVTVERTGLIVELREMIEHWQGVQMLVSSRPDMRETMGWMDFHLLELRGLEKKQIDNYLGQWGLSPLIKDGDEEKYPLRRLLQNPMMLTIYATSCEVVKEYGASSLYDFKKRVETPGELLWNFMEAQVVKYFQHSGLEEPQKYFYKFLLKMLLPALGYEMEKAGRFQLAGNELDVIVECYLKRFCQADFLDTFREYRRYASTWGISNCSEIEGKSKFEEVLGILSDEMSMLVKEGQSYRFLHQDFRDFFAAVHILNEVAMKLGRYEVTEVLTIGMISFYPRRYMGEIEGEHYCKPFLEEGKGWQIKSNDSTLLGQTLKLCRGNFGKTYAYAVANILECWKQVRGEWSGLDLSRLDLSKVLINGTVSSRLYKKTYLAARLDESLIPAKSIFPEGHSDLIESAVYSPDGQKILSASRDNTIKEWDLDNRNSLRTYQGHKGYVFSAVYSADGQKILSASMDGTIKEWDVSSGTCLRTYQGHKRGVNKAVYSADNQKILSVSWDETIKEWDVARGGCMRTYQGHKDNVTSVLYSADGQKILSASWDGTIKEWDTISGKCLQTYQGHKGYVTSAVYSADGQKILSTSWDGTIKEWDKFSGTCMRTYKGHESVVCNALYKTESKKIISASDDGTIKEWDTETGVCLRTYQGHESYVRSAAYSVDGEKILSASWDRTIKEWDTISGTCLHTYQGHKSNIKSAIFSSDGQKILATSDDNTIIEWDTISGTCLHIYHGHISFVYSAVYSGDGQKILSASRDNTIKEWDTETGTCLRTYQGHKDTVISALYSADGQKILSASWDHTIKEWDTVSGACLRTYQGDRISPKIPLYSADGQKIICAHDEYTIKEWDVTTGACLRIYQGHKRIIESIVYSIDGHKILSASDDNTIKEWDVATGTCLKTWNSINESPLDHYPDFHYNKKFENRIIKKNNPITIINRQTGAILQTFENISGLFIQGCSFKNLHPDSKLSDEEKELLKMYGGTVE